MKNTFKFKRYKRYIIKIFCPPLSPKHPVPRPQSKQCYLATNYFHLLTEITYGYIRKCIYFLLKYSI